MEDGLIVATGQEKDSGLWLRPGDQVWDADGAWILPAWTDSHLHVFYLADQRRYVDLYGCTSADDLARCR